MTEAILIKKIKCPRLNEIFNLRGKRGSFEVFVRFGYRSNKDPSDLTPTHIMCDLYNWDGDNKCHTNGDKQQCIYEFWKSL